ncbi:MAG: TRAP transporter large permease subunit [Methylococcaceae bacterium]|jgi:TRAP-type C4-dicarboxylate transport system permease large subunit
MLDKFLQRSWQEWISSLPVFLLLITIVFAGNGQKIHAQLLKAGESIWHDYFTLRGDIPIPACNVNPDIELELNKLATETDKLDDLFANQPFDREQARISLEGARQLCVKKHQLAQQNRARITPAVIVFRSLETSVAAISIFAFKNDRFILALMVFICAITCSIRQRHIAFRSVTTLLDNRIACTAQLLGNFILVISAWVYRNSVYQSSAVVDHPEIYPTVIIGFLALCAVNLYQLAKLRQGIKPGGKLLNALATIPLYSWMAIASGSYFFLIEGNAAGLAIFFSLLFDQASLFLNIGLYIWVGMLVAQTCLGELVFYIFKPWHLSPELLAVVAIVIMAVPTAYTGASGIIIIAMGTAVYKELRRVGARRQLALAATAMSGSVGVVLKPCLLVVLIAALNKEVVTDQLFSWGLKTFMTSATVFCFYMFISKREKMLIAPAHEAFKPCLKALLALFPYFFITLFVALTYIFLLNAYLDEFSAPVILPVIILGMVIYEKLFAYNSLIDRQEQKMHNLEYEIRFATSETTILIGALLLLMGLSFVLGGVIERSGLLNALPEFFGSIWTTLGFLIVVLIGIGMIMDPYGAVVLVSGTVAQIAYKNGINPIHFWMMALVAFELGYLSPPVALNQLLTRQIVGEKEVAKAELEGDSFWYRHEKTLLPIVTMGTTLILVSIVPILVGLYFAS